MEDGGDQVQDLHLLDQALVQVQGQVVGHQDLHPRHHLLHQVVAEVDLGLEEDHQAHLHQANLHQVVIQNKIGAAQVPAQVIPSNLLAPHQVLVIQNNLLGPQVPLILKISHQQELVDSVNLSLL